MMLRTVRMSWFQTPIFLTLLFLGAPAWTQAAGYERLGESASTMKRVDPPQKEKIERLLKHLPDEDIPTLTAALKDFDRFSTYWRTVETGQVFLATAGATVGVLAWFNALKIMKIFATVRTIGGALKLWAAGGLAGAAFVMGGLYLIHRYSIRPDAVKKLDAVLDSLMEKIPAEVRISSGPTGEPATPPPSSPEASEQFASNSGRVSILGRKGITGSIQ